MAASKRARQRARGRRKAAARYGVSRLVGVLHIAGACELMRHATQAMALQSSPRFEAVAVPLPIAEQDRRVAALQRHAEQVGITIGTVTCHGCDQNAVCPWAWDLYNTDGDCLAEK